jgi:hypothetical protein
MIKLSIPRGMTNAAKIDIRQAVKIIASAIDKWNSLDKENKERILELLEEGAKRLKGRGK